MFTNKRDAQFRFSINQGEIMKKFEYRVNQNEVEKAFGGLTAAEAAEIILGRRLLTEEQKDILERAAGGGQYNLRFDPKPVGHIAFVPAGTRGTGNSGWHILVPYTTECRRLVNSARRAEFAKLIKAPRYISDRIFTEVRGYEPALNAVIGIWPILSKCPTMSNRALRDAGFRPGHPHEGMAIAAVRAALGVSMNR